MKRILYVSVAVLSASCGASYSPNSDLAPDPNQPAQIVAATNQVCRQCTADADCGPNAFCATEDATGDQFCTAPCYSDGTCDSGLTCFTIDDNGNTGCYPSSGTCEGIIATSGGVGAGSGTDSGTTDTGSTTTGATTTGATTTGTTTAGATTTGTTTAGATTTGSTTTAGATSNSTTTAGATSTGNTTAGATTTGTTTAGATTTGSGTTTGASSTTGTTTGTCTTDSWNTTMKTFFTSNCSSCHNVSKSFADSGKSRIDSGAMPPNGGLSSSDIQRVDTWIGCGSP